MIHVMRRHRKLILWGMVILIVPTFVLWGGYRRSARNREREAVATGTVARVGSVPVSAAMFRRSLDAEASRRGEYADRPTFQEMTQDGTANRVLDRLIDQALLEYAEAQRSFTCETEFLVDRLKKDPSFQTEDGRFDAMTWNSFVDSGKDRNWNALYANVNNQVKREVLLATIQASGRVLDEEVRDQFDQAYSTLQVKYLQVAPTIEPTDEQVQAQYDEDPTLYQIPEKYSAEYVAISLMPPRPPLVDELVERARAGEDFAELATAHSQAYDAQRGGDMGWVSERPNMPEYQRTILSLPVGEISDPVEGANAYFIYTVEEERTNETSGLREVKGRQIQIRPQLTEEEQAEREGQAADLLVKAKESGDLAAAAADAGLALGTAGTFSADTTELDNIARIDVRTFVRAFEQLEAGKFPDVIKGRENLYVAKVTEVEPAIPQPLEAVRDRVKQDAIQKIRTSDEYAQEIEALCEEIAANATSLEDIQKLHPELEGTIQESKEFTVKGNPMVPGAMFRSADVYLLFKGKEPGAFAGPVEGPGAPRYFLELVALEPPSEEEWPEEKRAEEVESVREAAIQMRQYQRVADYLTYLKGRTPIEFDNAMFARVIGIDESQGEEEHLTFDNGTVPVPVEEGPDF